MKNPFNFFGSFFFYPEFTRNVLTAYGLVLFSLFNGISTFLGYLTATHYCRTMFGVISNP